MNPKFIFLLMVLIIIGLWFSQKAMAKKNEDFSQREREYYEAIKKFLKQEITEEELKNSAESFFALTGTPNDQMDQNIQKDLAAFKA